MCAQVPSGSSGVDEGYLAVDHAQLYYRVLGQGQPLMLLHGGPSFSHTYLLPDMDRLADAFHLIYFDQRGRGKSARNVDPAGVNIQSEIDDLEALRAHWHLEQAAILGHSWGGLLAMEYAIRHPERVSHLILLNTAPASHDDCVLFEQERDGNAPKDAAKVGELDIIQDGGLRCVIKDIDLDSDQGQTYPPLLLRPLSEREFVVVTQDENEGAQVDFIEGSDGAIRFLRMDGRLYDPVVEDARR